MITELDYIAYFENLATQSKDFNHVAGTKDAFFYIPEPYDLAEIDKAIKQTKSVPFMMLDAMTGGMGESTAHNYSEGINAQITILDMATVGDAVSIRAVRDNCLAIGVKLLGRLAYDSRKQLLIEPGARFNFNNIKFDPVGPIAQKHYGITFRFLITCPFGFTVDSTIWRDIPA
jgi:hypothetical protein